MKKKEFTVRDLLKTLQTLKEEDLDKGIKCFATWCGGTHIWDIVLADETRIELAEESIYKMA